MKEIVVIDDEQIIRKGIGKIVELSGEGFEVTAEAENGEEGLRLILKLDPDIAIVDVKMPKMDGLEMIEHCLRHENLKTRFIVLSAYDDYAYTRRSIKLGVCDYLLKPVNRFELIGLLKEVAAKVDRSVCGKISEALESELPLSEQARVAADAMRYIEKHFYDDLSLREVAEKAGMNPNYFAGLFKKKTGVSYLDYLTAVRIEKAKELLKSTDLKVYEISQMIGYYSAKYFSKLFKHHTGMTPNEWRTGEKNGCDERKEYQI